MAWTAGRRLRGKPVPIALTVAVVPFRVSTRRRCQRNTVTLWRTEAEHGAHNGSCTTDEAPRSGQGDHGTGSTSSHIGRRGTPRDEHRMSTGSVAPPGRVG